MREKSFVVKKFTKFTTCYYIDVIHLIYIFKIKKRQLQKCINKKTTTKNNKERKILTEC